MRIAVVLLGIAVLVYFAVQAVQRRRVARRVRPAAPPVARPSPRAELDFQRTVRERAERQRRGTTVPQEPPVEPPVVVVDDDVFAEDPEGYCNESFLVVSSAPVHHVVEAVGRANDRFMLVDEEGTDHSGSGAPEDVLAALAERDIYTPNYAADPVITDAGVQGYVDCKGAISDDMGRMLKRVLREELEVLGHPARVQVAPRSD